MSATMKESGWNNGMVPEQILWRARERTAVAVRVSKTIIRYLTQDGPDDVTARAVPLECRMTDLARSATAGGAAAHAAAGRTRAAHAAARAGRRRTRRLIAREILRVLQIVLGHGDLQLRRSAVLARNGLERRRGERHFLGAHAEEAAHAHDERVDLA